MIKIDLAKSFDRTFGRQELRKELHPNPFVFVLGLTSTGPNEMVDLV